MLRDFINSIKSISAYEEFKKKKLTKVLLYLLIFSLFTGFFFASAFQTRYSEIITLIPENYDSKFPDFKIENGELTTDKSEKVVIEKNKVAIIFDTSSSADENALYEYKKGALLLKDRVVIKTSRFGKMEKKWIDIINGNLNKEKVREYLGIIPSMLVLLTVFSMVGLVLLNVILSLFIALIFTLVKRFWKKKLSFSEVFKMTVHSLTLPMVLIALGSSFIGDILTMRHYYYAYYLSPIYLMIAIGRTDLPKRVGKPNKKQGENEVGRPKKKKSKNQ
jgi:maltodextrin utilization protein YvdJ